MKHEIVVIAHNLRSTHNVGSLLRTADGLGVTGVFLTGYSPYPETPDDSRLPHERSKITRQIHKTALGAEQSVVWKHSDALQPVLVTLKKQGFTIAALEQHKGSVKLPNFTAPQRIAIIIGREVEGIEPEILKYCDVILEIPMRGQKESFNVVQAAAIAIYHLTFS